MSDDCICIIPKGWPKWEPWAHHEACPKRLRLIRQLRERWCGR